MQPGEMPDFGQLMQQAQQMQVNMARAQEQLQNSTVTGSAGGGLVSVTMTGSAEITAVAIDPKVVDPDDIESLQDLIVAAARDASTKAADLTQQVMGEVTGGLGGLEGMGGLGLPGM